MVRPLAIAASLTLLVVACQGPSPLGRSAVLKGRVSFPPTGFQTAMTGQELVDGATVSLVATDKTTVAAGVTDPNGAFTLTTPSPAIGSYQLIAAKRVNGDGRMLQLCTMADWDGTGWDSIASSLPEVAITPATTAVTLIGRYFNTSTASLLQKVSLDPATQTYSVINPTTWAAPAQVTLANSVKDKVVTMIGQNVDPLRAISYVDTVASDGVSPTPGATPGLTRFKIQGFGFDPVPERNSFGIRYGGDTYWSTGLPGSTATTLYARCPVVPRPPDGKGYLRNVEFVVRNGANVESIARSGQQLTLFYPWQIPDPAIKLPSDRATSLGPGRVISSAINPNTGLVYSVWQDLRFAANNTDYSPVVRTWDWNSGAISSFNPRASLPNPPVSPGGDPSLAPLAIFQDMGGAAPTVRRLHVIWQGTGVTSGRPGIYHRILENEAWKVGNFPAVTTPVGAVAVSPLLDNGAPSAILENGRLTVAYLNQYTGGGFNVQTKTWLTTAVSLASGAADWSTPSAVTHTINATTKSALAPQIAFGGTNVGALMYHLVWMNYQTIDVPGTAMIQYRRALPANVPSTGAIWDPTPISINPPITFQAGVGAIQGLTFAADPNNNLMAVWLAGATPTFKHVPTGTTLPNIPGLPTGTVPTLPLNASETTPQLVMVGVNDFYLVTASRPDGPPSVAGDIWLRRFKDGTWGQPLRVFASPGVLSENPHLGWNGTSLTVSWIEGRVPVIMPLIDHI
jgi:hypothetical protein